jgi:hypothetical protein
MNVEGPCPAHQDAKLVTLIQHLEQILAELDSLGIGRVALGVHEAIELARAEQALRKAERPGSPG